MKFIAIIILFTHISLASLSQSSQIINRDQLAHTVMLLMKDTIKFDTTKKLDKKEAISGTGLFVECKKELYLVTAAHVAKSMDLNSYLFISGSNDTPIRLNLTDLIMEAKPNWIFHNRADLAVLKLKPLRRILLSGVLEGKFIALDYISRDSVNAVSRDKVLTVIGFPLSLGIGKRFSPLTFRTYASSGFITMPRADTKKQCDFLILENPSVGGYSGGPVFDISATVMNAVTITGEGTKCYGFVHGTISDETGGKLALVTPSYFLFDLIN